MCKNNEWWSRTYEVEKVKDRKVKDRKVKDRKLKGKNELKHKTHDYKNKNVIIEWIGEDLKIKVAKKEGKKDNFDVYIIWEKN